jgi:hypothetical protein
VGRIKELFVLGLPFGTKYLRAFYLLLVLIALVLGASATESAGGAGG